MKVLVAVKRVLDHAVRPRVNAERTGVDLSNTKLVMNPFDEVTDYALEADLFGAMPNLLATLSGP
jgi:electron transfer flavoprotein beta subunit